MLQNGVSHRYACVKLSTKGGCRTPFRGSAKLPEKVSRDMGYRSDSTAVSRDMGPLSKLPRGAIYKLPCVQLINNPFFAIHQVFALSILFSVANKKRFQSGRCSPCEQRHLRVVVDNVGDKRPLERFQGRASVLCVVSLPCLHLPPWCPKASSTPHERNSIVEVVADMQRRPCLKNIFQTQGLY